MRKPARNWTIEELAKDVGLSRSVLAERFTDLVGMPPMHYLAKWRMQIASGLLGGGANIAAVAAEIGYGSEAAFSRAFKKMVGVPPSAWRRHAPAGRRRGFVAGLRRNPSRRIGWGFHTKGVIAGFVITVGEDGFAVTRAPADSRRVVKVKTWAGPSLPRKRSCGGSIQ